MIERLLLSALIVLPCGVFAALGMGWLLGWRAREAWVAQLTSLCYGAVLTALAGLWLEFLSGGRTPLRAELGTWFTLGDHHYPLILWADAASLSLMTLSAVLLSIVAVFSRSYMHRDPGYFRFFMLLNLFGAGIFVLFAAGTFELIVIGWELICTASVLLIAFFQHRDEPAEGALRVFAVYRFCDIGLFLGVLLMYHFAGSTEFGAPLNGGEAAIVGALLLLAAMGKGAQVPFSGWLPRAMEGPTPSSAIFYGALSVHAGAYLLLRAQPILAASGWVSEATTLVGLLTALHGTFVGRTCPDAKTSLAYASVTQLGLIFMEIGLGWKTLALWHIAGHSILRTAQFLRAPSLLHDHHQMFSAAGGHLSPTGAYLKAFLPRSAQTWLYRLALDRGHHDVFIERFFIGPAFMAARRLDMIEKKCEGSDA